MYLPGDTVLITDIGVFTSSTDPGTSLVCVTSNVNTECWVIDNPNGGALGEWHFPDGTIIPSYSADPKLMLTLVGVGSLMKSGSTVGILLPCHQQGPMSVGYHHWEVEHW